MNKDRSILSTCPCCEASVVIDLSSGELWPSDQVKLQPQWAEKGTTSYSSGISVIHATPGFGQYIDPTHIKQQSRLLPLAKQQEQSDEEEPMKPVTPDQIKEIEKQNIIDQRNRGIYQ